MAETPPAKVHPLVRKLASIAVISADERQALTDLPMQVLHLRADQDIVREGDRPSRCCVLLDGFGCAYKVTGGGKRQILSFQFEGDIPDLHSVHLSVLDSSLGTITPCLVGFIQHEAVRAICRDFPAIADAFWRSTLIDAGIFREWMVNIGRRPTLNRMAHLLCETVVRSKAVGLGTDHSFPLPFTQSEFADAMGVSTVHVNRTVRELRTAGLISITDSKLHVHDWEGLKQAGEFDPTYLHLTHPRQMTA